MILAWVVFGLGASGAAVLAWNVAFGRFPPGTTQADKEAWAFGWCVGFTVAVVVMLVGAALLDAAYGTAIW